MEIEKEATVRVRKFLEGHGLVDRILHIPSTTRTAVEAAAALGCGVDQIAKSIIFKGAVSGAPVLVIACGGNRVNEAQIAPALGEGLAKADANFVREKTGFIIGGVSPVAHLSEMKVFLDEDLFKFKELWAAAGSAFAVFRVSPQELVTLTGVQPTSVR